MAIRPIKLPDDLTPLANMTVEAFQYPENENWSMQTDEMESIVESMQNLSQIWPVIRLILLIAPRWHDLIRGYVWEQENRIVGYTLIQRLSSTDTWIISGVGVLPDYRRKGIARQLMIAALDLIRECGGKIAQLDVIDGNEPAVKLYESLGFEQFSSSLEFTLTPGDKSEEPAVPEDYSQESTSIYDWKPRYELEKRITPEHMLKYEPVEERRYKQPFSTRLVRPAVMTAQGTRDQQFIMRTKNTGFIAARCIYRVTTRSSGINTLSARLDPAHSDLASYIVNYMLFQVINQSPGNRIEFSVPDWQQHLAEAAYKAGFEKRLEMFQMGVIL